MIIVDTIDKRQWEKEKAQPDTLYFPTTNIFRECTEIYREF